MQWPFVVWPTPTRQPVLLEERTCTAVEAVLETGTETAVITVEWVEQQARTPHSLWTLAGDELTRRVAESLGDPRATTPAVEEAILERITEADVEGIEVERDAVYLTLW